MCCVLKNDVSSAQGGRRSTAKDKPEEIVPACHDIPFDGFLDCPDTVIKTPGSPNSEVEISIVARPQHVEGLLSHSRDIRITAGEHNTIFDSRVHQMSDLPPEVRKIFEYISLIPDVLEVFLGRFWRVGGNGRDRFRLSLSRPQENSGRIFGKLKGPGRIGNLQEIRIRVTKGWELVTFLKLTELRLSSPPGIR